MARFVILGASGFIGRHVLAELEREEMGHALLCLGRSKLPGQTRWLPLDLTACSPAELAAVLQRFQPDAVINCAGRTEGSFAELMAANAILVDTLLEAVSLGAPLARIVQLSSAAEYGAVKPGSPICEDDRPQPSSQYAITKLAATQLLSQAQTEGRANTMILRIFNPIGAGLDPSSVLGRAALKLQQALATEADSLVMGSLEAYRDFIDVRDVARAVVKAALLDTSGDTVFNIARGHAVQVRELVRQLADLTGFKGEIEEQAFGSPRSSAVSWQQANIERAARALNWTPTFELDSSLEAVWQSFVRPRAIPEGALHVRS